MLRLAGMEAAHPNGVFELPEGGFYAPPGIIRPFQALWGKLIFREVRHKAFKRAIRQIQPDDTEGQRICAVRSVFEVIERGRLVHKAAEAPVRDRDFFGMAAHKGDSDNPVESSPPLGG